MATAHRIHRCCVPGCFICEATPPRDACAICGGCGPSLTTECPGRVLTCEEMIAVLCGETDFKDGDWIALTREVAA